MRNPLSLFARLCMLIGTLLWFATPTLSYAQAAVQQVGPVTPGDPALWWRNGQIVDSSQFPTWLSQTLDQQIGATPGEVLCRGASGWTTPSPGATGQVLTAQTSNCPVWATGGGGGGSGATRIISSGSTDAATTADNTIFWNSAATSAKSETFFACTSGVVGHVLIIKDSAGTAGTYAITITPASGTIDGASNATITANSQGLQFQCDGAGNWASIAAATQNANMLTYVPSFSGAVTQPASQQLNARVDINQFLTPTQVGQIANCTATFDATTALQNAMSAVSITAGGIYTTGHGLVKLHAGCYNFLASLHIRNTVVLDGDGGTGIGSGASTIFKFPASTAGIYLEAANGNNCTTGGGTSSSAAGTVLRGITVISATGPLDVNGAQNGITACVNFYLDHTSIYYFPGDQLQILTTNTFGNADVWRVEGGQFLGNGGNSRYGVYLTGANSNTGQMHGTLITNVGGGCVQDVDAIGLNKFDTVVCESAGSSLTAAFANRTGVSYMCLVAGATTCKTTTPGTDSTVWYPITFNAGYGTYSSSTTYIAASEYGATVAGQRNLFLNDYSEVGDPLSNVAGPNVIQGGNLLFGGSGVTTLSTATGINNGDGNYWAVQGGAGGYLPCATGSSYMETIVGGGNLTSSDILRAKNSCVPGGSGEFRLSWFAPTGPDVIVSWDDSATQTPIIFSGDQTTKQFGRGANQPYQVEFNQGAFFSQGNDNGNARWIGMCAGSTPTTIHAAGDICFNTSATNSGDILFWYATVGGTPATWRVGANLGVFVSSGAVPVLTGTCTTGTVTGGKSVFFFTATCTAQTVIITLPTVATGWVCSAHDETTPADSLKQIAHSTTTATLSGTTAASDAMAVSCVAA